MARHTLRAMCAVKAEPGQTEARGEDSAASVCRIRVRWTTSARVVAECGLECPERAAPTDSVVSRESCLTLAYVGGHAADFYYMGMLRTARARCASSAALEFAFRARRTRLAVVSRVSSVAHAGRRRGRRQSREAVVVAADTLMVDLELCVCARHARHIVTRGARVSRVAHTRREVGRTPPRVAPFRTRQLSLSHAVRAGLAKHARVVMDGNLAEAVGAYTRGDVVRRDATGAVARTAV